MADFEQKFSLAKVLYTESKKHIGFTGFTEYDSMVVVNESELINAILEQDTSVFEILRDAEGTERTTHPSKKLTALSCSKCLFRTFTKNSRNA